MKLVHYITSNYFFPCLTLIIKMIKNNYHALTILKTILDIQIENETWPLKTLHQILNSIWRWQASLKVQNVFPHFLFLFYLYFICTILNPPKRRINQGNVFDLKGHSFSFLGKISASVKSLKTLKKKNNFGFLFLFLPLKR